MSSFFSAPFFKCSVNYGMALLFLITSNIFIYFLILYNLFNINWGPNEITIRFIFWMFAEMILLIFTRSLCTIENNSSLESEESSLLD
jgi:hypothetical protein